MHFLDELIESTPERLIPAGTEIFRQGDTCQQYFILSEGCARVYARSESGKEILLYHVNPDKICALTVSCLLGQNRYPAEAIAETDLKVRIINKATFDQLMEKSSGFRKFVMDGFGERMRDLIGTIHKVAFESIEQRLIKLLLLQPDNRITLTHQKIAEEIGSVREVVSRQLKRLESKELIQLGRGQIEIVNRAALYNLT